VSRMCANVGNAARMTHDQKRGHVYFPASQGVAGQLGNSPNLSAILAIFEKLYVRFIFAYVVAGEGERSDQPETKYRGLSRESTPGDRKALAWLEQQVKPAWSNQELCSE
jgi:hypothetical protein